MTVESKPVAVSTYLMETCPLPRNFKSRFQDMVDSVESHAEADEVWLRQKHVFEILTVLDSADARFTVLQRKIGINAHTLSRKLKNLLFMGVVFKGSCRRGTYHITEKGITALQWLRTLDATSRTTTRRVSKRLKESRESDIARIRMFRTLSAHVTSLNGSKKILLQEFGYLLIESFQATRDITFAFRRAKDHLTTRLNDGRLPFANLLYSVSAYRSFIT